PRNDHALENRDARIAEDELLAHATACAEAAAFWTCPERRIEREVARLELGERDAAGGTAVSLGEELDNLSFAVAHLDEPFGELERGLERIGESAPIRGTDDQSVDNYFDRVILPPIELRRVGNLDELAVD